MSIDNTDNVIDSRDVIARIEELEGYRDSAAEETTEAKFTAADGTEYNETSDWDEDAAEELAKLKAFAEEASGYGDWDDGETMIRDSYFEDYAQELAEDCGMTEKSDKWPYTCIDWEKAARELQQDYSSYEFDGVTYWGRS